MRILCLGSTSRTSTAECPPMSWTGSSCLSTVLALTWRADATSEGCCLSGDAIVLRRNHSALLLSPNASVKARTSRASAPAHPRAPAYRPAIRYR